MAKQKKPSIYSHRGTIGSSRELDEYGVWVKSEPQDLSEVTADFANEIITDTATEITTDFPDETSDLDIPDMDELPGFDDSSDLTADLDAEDDEMEIPEMGNDFGKGKPSGLSEELDSFDPIPIDEFSDDDLSEKFSIDDLSEDSLSNLGDFSSGLDDSEIEALDDLDTPAEPEEIPEPIDDEPESLGFTEVSEDVLSEDAVMEEAAIEESMDISPAEDLLSGDLPLEDLSSNDLFIDDLSLEDTSEELTVDDLSEELPEHTCEENPVDSGLSTQLLLRIADELSSIRDELKSLKNGFKTLKAEVAEDKVEHEQSFYAEEDEKIALTGDELNNILNTADFTEETGTDPTNMETAISPDESLSGEDNTGSSDSGDSETFSINDLDGGLDLNLELAEDDLDELPGEINMGEAITADLLDSPDALNLTESAESFDSIDSVDSIESLDLSDSSELLNSAELLNSDDIINLDDNIIIDDSADSIDLSTELSDESAELSDDSTFPDFGEEAGDELLELSEKGASHMTSAPEPEDADYLLKEEPLGEADFGEQSIDEAFDISLDDNFADNGSDADDSTGAPDSIDTIEDSVLDENSLDLSEAVIDEPDLSMDIQDNPIEEPSLENITIDLDLDESVQDEMSLDAGIGNDEPADAGLSDGPDIHDDLEFPEELEISDDLDLPAEDESEPEIIDFSDNSSGIDYDEISGIGQEDDLALIPEGFVVASENEPADLPAEEPVMEDLADNQFDDLSTEEAVDDGLTTDDLSFTDTAFEDFTEQETEDEAVSQQEIDSVIKPRETAQENPIPTHLKQELKAVLTYMDKLLESLPDEKIEEFAKSEHFDTYKKLFRELGLS